MENGLLANNNTKSLKCYSRMDCFTLPLTAIQYVALIHVIKTKYVHCEPFFSSKILYRKMPSVVVAGKKIYIPKLLASKRADFCVKCR